MKQWNRLKQNIRSMSAALINRATDLLRSQEGIGTVEVVLLILVAVGLVLIFRERIEALVSSVFEKITSRAGSL